MFFLLDGMNPLHIFFLILVILIVNYFVRDIKENFEESRAQIERFVPERPPIYTNFEPLYERTKDELKDVDTVLSRETKSPTGEHELSISNIEPARNETDSFDVFTPPDRLAVVPPSKETLELVSKLQPGFLGESPLLNGEYYYDSRFPERPISMKFLTDPSFCTLERIRYPCNRL
jgi:hypothetical protein